MASSGDRPNDRVCTKVGGCRVGEYDETLLEVVSMVSRKEE